MIGLVEQLALVMAGNQAGMQRPIEIVAPAEPRALHGGQRIEHLARPHGQAGRAQTAAEMHDVAGKLAAIGRCGKAQAFGHA